MSEQATQLADQLAKIANAIAEEVLNPETQHPLETKIAALQRLSAFWAMILKIEPEATPTSSMKGYQDAITASTAERARGRNGNGAARPYAINLADGADE